MSSPAASTAASRPPANVQRTEYVVLVQVDDDGWREAPEKVEAASATAAVKRYLADNPTSRAGGYVAVPARSWQPLRQQTKTITTTTLEPVGSEEKA